MSVELNLDSEEYIGFLKNMLDLYHNAMNETENVATKQFCIANINMINVVLQAAEKDNVHTDE